MSSRDMSQFSMYPHEPQTWSTGLTAAKMFHRLTRMMLPAPPSSRFPGTRMMSMDWHFGHFFVFFIDASFLVHQLHRDQPSLHPGVATLRVHSHTTMISTGGRDMLRLLAASLMVFASIVAAVPAIACTPLDSNSHCIEALAVIGKVGATGLVVGPRLY